MRIDAVAFDAAADRIAELTATRHEVPGRAAPLVCAANVHMTMEAYDDPEFRDIVNAADFVVADGMPLVWALRLLGVPSAERVRMTPDLLLAILTRAVGTESRVGLYGGTEASLVPMQTRLLEEHPDLDIVYRHAPPFRPLTREEDQAVIAAIQAADVDLLLVGIGCPKQERWMAAHRTDLDCVMLGVGAAFDLLAGNTREAPRWMQRSGLEWVHRLAQDPRRLWRRYARNNPRFLLLLASQVIATRRHARCSGGSRDAPRV